MDKGRSDQKILISANSFETRIALLVDDRLTELYLENTFHQRIVGNIYKGRVARVLPGMQAAFVDIGLGKDAFYYVHDVYRGWTESADEEVDEDNDNDEPGAIAADATAEAVQLTAPSRPPADKEPPEARGRNRSIASLLTAGQEVLVQVAKEPIGTKGARVTSHIAIPGRYLVLMPAVTHVGVSKRIEDAGERDRLKKLIKGIRKRPMGLIVRTAGEGRSEEDFVRDMEFLLKLWDGVRSHYETSTAATCLHQDLDPILRTVRDLFTGQVERLLIDHEPAYLRCLEYAEVLVPQLTSRVRLYTGSTPLFEKFGVDNETRKAMEPKVWLKSGGYIVIEQTEALVAIDVNTGRFIGKASQEETITQTNLEAAGEIVRQIRLRDLGGIIVIDFIDMEEEENRRKVLQVLLEALKDDRAPSKVLTLTELGMVEMTRKRVKRSLAKSLEQTCPYCNGAGVVSSTRTVCLDLYREVMRLAGQRPRRELLIRVHPEVAATLRGMMKEVLADMERLLDGAVTVQSDEGLHMERYDIVSL